MKSVVLTCVHVVAVVLVALAAGIAAAHGWTSMHALLTSSTESSTFAWAELGGLDGLILGCALVALADARAWSAWLAVILSIPANLAANHPALGWMSVYWAPLAVLLSSAAFSPLAFRHHRQEVGQ